MDTSGRMHGVRRHSLSAIRPISDSRICPSSTLPNTRRRPAVHTVTKYTPPQ